MLLALMAWLAFWAGYGFPSVHPWNTWFTWLILAVTATFWRASQ